MVTYRQAGLVPLSLDQHILAIVERRWRKWTICDLSQGDLSVLTSQAKHLPVALATPDDRLLHWSEEFPAHLSPAAIRRYVKQSKAEWFNEPGHHLTLEPLERLTPTLQHLRCWLLTDASYRSICQIYLDHGFHIGALEPDSCLKQRPMPTYCDPNHRLASIDPASQPQALTACKLACRFHWA